MSQTAEETPKGAAHANNLAMSKTGRTYAHACVAKELVTAAADSTIGNMAKSAASKANGRTIGAISSILADRLSGNNARPKNLTLSLADIGLTTFSDECQESLLKLTLKKSIMGMEQELLAANKQFANESEAAGAQALDVAVPSDVTCPKPMRRRLDFGETSSLKRFCDVLQIDYMVDSDDATEKKDVEKLDYSFLTATQDEMYDSGDDSANS